MHLTTLTSTVVLASGSSGDDGTGFAWLLLLAGPAFYTVMYLRYRNADKRHRHETETRASMHDVRAADSFNRSLRGLSNRRMKGANNRSVNGARGPGGVAGMIGGLVDD